MPRKKFMVKLRYVKCGECVHQGKNKYPKCANVTYPDPSEHHRQGSLVCAQFQEVG